MNIVIEKIERNNLIYERYKQIVSEIKMISPNLIYKSLINRTYPCFYVSPERAEKLILYAISHDDNQQANDLLEIYNKVSRGRSIKNSIYDVIAHSSPRLYMSLHTIKRIIQSKRKESRQKRIMKHASH